MTENSLITVHKQIEKRENKINDNQLLSNCIS